MAPLWSQPQVPTHPILVHGSPQPEQTVVALLLLGELSGEGPDLGTSPCTDLPSWTIGVPAGGEDVLWGLGAGGELPHQLQPDAPVGPRHQDAASQRGHLQGGETVTVVTNRLHPAGLPPPWRDGSTGTAQGVVLGTHGDSDGVSSSPGTLPALGRAGGPGWEQCSWGHVSCITCSQ